MHHLKLSDISLASTRGRHHFRSGVFRTVNNFYQLYWRFVFAAIWPLLCLFVFIAGTSKGIRCFYVSLVMWGYYTFDALPEGITSVIPIFALPLLAVQHTYTTCSLYFQYGFFVMNALTMAVCIDYSKVHERVILYLMHKFGGTPRVVHAVLSTICMLISIRIANAYTVTLLLPLTKKILFIFDEHRAAVYQMKMSSIDFSVQGKKEKPLKLSMAFFYGIIMASGIGGINFVTGSITNMIFRSVYQRRYPYCTIAQTQWYIYTIPITVVSFIVSLFWIQILYLGKFVQICVSVFMCESPCKRV